MEGKGQRILMTYSRRPMTMGIGDGPTRLSRGARFSFASATGDAKAGQISKSLAGTLCTAVAEEGLWYPPPSVVTRGGWRREWSSQRSDEAHATTPGVVIIELRRTGGPIVCNEPSERRTGVVREPRREALSFSLGPVTGS